MVLISKILVPSAAFRPVLSYDVIKVKLKGQKVKLFNDMKGGQVTPHFKGQSEYIMLVMFFNA